MVKTNFCEFTNILFYYFFFGCLLTFVLIVVKVTKYKEKYHILNQSSCTPKHGSSSFPSCDLRAWFKI